MNDDFKVAYLSPDIYRLLGSPEGYDRRMCEQCEGVGRFISYCWSVKGDVVDCPVCDATGILYVLIVK